jgi:predicted AAA+ superfamily ATPase
LYFLDTELPSYLLRIRAAADLRIHAQYGSIFESYVISELFKNYLNRGEEHPIYFWPDSTGNEIDIIIDEGDRLIPLEIKAGHTVSSDFLKGFVSGKNCPTILNNHRHWCTEGINHLSGQIPMLATC